MSKAIICDKCDLILPTDGEYKVITPLDPVEYRVRDEREVTHLCHDCFERFKEWVVEREAE